MPAMSNSMYRLICLVVVGLLFVLSKRGVANSFLSPTTTIRSSSQNHHCHRYKLYLFRSTKKQIRNIFLHLRNRRLSSSSSSRSSPFPLSRKVARDRNVDKLVTKLNMGLNSSTVTAAASINNNLNGSMEDDFVVKQQFSTPSTIVLTTVAKPKYSDRYDVDNLDLLNAKNDKKQTAVSPSSSSQSPDSAQWLSKLVGFENSREGFERERLLIDLLDVYVLIGALTSTASFVALSQSPQPYGLTTISLWTTTTVLYYLSIIVSALSVLTGLHATVVFSMSFLYLKTALGMRREDAYEMFKQNTQKERSTGFQAFRVSLALFMVELVLVVGSKAPDGIIRWPIMYGIAISSLFIFQEWKVIADQAALVFADSATNPIQNNDLDEN